jgi:hypothetical protein
LQPTKPWLPVILVVYDAVADAAYWLYLQAYFQQRVELNLTFVAETINIHISTANVVDLDAIRQFALFKARVLGQYEGFRHEIL